MRLPSYAALALVATTLTLPVATTSLSAPAAGADGSSRAAAGTPARATTHHRRFTTKDRMVTVHDGFHRQHTATIDTRLYRPRHATRAHPRPAILMTHGFGLSKTSAEVVNTATFLARHGYAVLTYTSQGFGASSGCVTLQSRQYDVKDARQLI